MAIEFLDLLDDDGWEVFVPASSGPSAIWSEGGTLVDAPIDVARTFGDALRRSTSIDDSFGLSGIQLRRGFRTPLCEHDQDLQVLAFGGELTIEFAEVGDAQSDAQSVVLTPGRFAIIEAGTPYRLRSGTIGATYLQSWPLGIESVETRWHPDAVWAAR